MQRPWRTMDEGWDHHDVWLRGITPPSRQRRLLRQSHRFPRTVTDTGRSCWAAIIQ
jgi:hypothetical protein